MAITAQAMGYCPLGLSEMGILGAVRILANVLLLVPGVGLALDLTLLRNATTSLQIAVVLVATGASFVGGWLSADIRKGVVLPVGLLVSLLVGYAAFGAPYDVEPIGFAIFLSIMYGGLAAAIFSTGWVARRVVARIWK